MGRRMIFSSSAPQYKLLKTGQTTSYGSGTGVDDGALQVGKAKSYTVLTDGQYAGNTNIVVNGKTDAHSNACVQDNNTKLMWSRAASASVGPASDGLLPWTTTGSGGTAEGIFPYVAAANAAGLAGYSDWRVPNIYELFSLMNMEAPSGAPNTTAFPALPNTLWSSTTRPNGTITANTCIFTQANITNTAKTSTMAVLLVRGNPT